MVVQHSTLYGDATHIANMANIEVRVPYSQRYLFNAIPDSHNTNPTNPNTRYHFAYGTLNSMFTAKARYRTTLA